MNKIIENLKKEISVLLFIDNPVATYFISERNNRLLQPMDIDNIKKINTNIKNKNIVLNNRYKENEDIMYFYNTLNNFASKKDLVFLENNLSDLIITDRYYNFSFMVQNINDKLNEVVTYACYLPTENRIVIKNKNNKISLFHELFHLSSNPRVNDDIINGFCYFNEKISIGSGLDEGYTELLTQRYFGTINENTYIIEKSIAHALEQIITSEKMQSYYLNSNLKGLIEDLLKIQNKEQIQKFFKAYDFIHYTNNYTYINIETHNLIKKAMNYIIIFLFNNYCIILKKKEYDINYIKNELYSYYELLNFYININDYEEICYNKNMINNIVRKYFNFELNFNEKVKKKYL